MNEDNYRKLRDRLARCRGTPRPSLGEYGFYQFMVFYPCGSPSCIAGHALDIGGIALPDYLRGDSDAHITKLRDFLGVTDEAAKWLYYGRFSNQVLVEITPQDAIKALDHLHNGGAPEGALPGSPALS